MHRVIVVMSVLGMLLGLGAPASARSDPKHIFLPTSPVDLDPSFCGFPIHIEFPVNREYAKTETLADGTTVLHVTGSLVDVLSSPTKTLTQNASGPGDVFFAPDGTLTFVARGLDIFPLTPDQQAQTGLPGLVVLRGLTVLRFNPDGSAELVRQEGDAVSLCAALA